MNCPRLPSFLLLTVLLATAGVLTSCERDALQGNLVLSGSSTLAPIVAGQTSAWNKDHPRVKVRIEAIGSDAGLDRLVQFNEADLALVSRPLTDQDRRRAEAAGQELLEFPLAWDAVTLVVSESNTWATSLTRAQATLAFTSATLWSDLDPTWPNLPLHRFVLGPQSGTTDVFSAAVLEGDKQRLYANALVQTSEDDKILARGLSRVEGSLGFLGWTTVRESDVKLKVLALDGVSPTQASIQDRTYGIPRQLWMVATKKRWNDRAEVRSLVRHFFDHYDALLAETALVPLDSETRTAVNLLLRNNEISSN